MADYTDAGARRPVILYIIIAIALCVALIVGVWWAKIRSADYAQQQNGQQQTAQNNQPQGDSNSQNASQPSEQSQAQSSTPETATTTPQTAASQSPAPAHVSRVPATGPEQPFLQVLSMGAVVFAALSYIKARRRLQNLV
jgi:cytoskeletal protein RodZ